MSEIVSFNEAEGYKKAQPDGRSCKGKLSPVDRIVCKDRRPTSVKQKQVREGKRIRSQRTPGLNPLGIINSDKAILNWPQKRIRKQ